MTEKSILLPADETLQLRMMMHGLMATGLSESEALLRILPNDKDRRRKLNRWKSQGLWPPPEEDEGDYPGQVDRFESRSSALSDEDIPEEWLQRITGIINTTINAAILDYHNVQSDQTEEQVEALIREKLREGMADMEPAQPDRIVELVRTTVRQMMVDEPPAASALGENRAAPPRPRTVKGTRKLAVPRRKLQGTCDSALFELFENERQSRGFNVSQMIDFILYHHYGQPRLSFETEDRESKQDAGEEK
jgi:hypothetical protein